MVTAPLATIPVPNGLPFSLRVTVCPAASELSANVYWRPLAPLSKSSLALRFAGFESGVVKSKVGATKLSEIGTPALVDSLPLVSETTAVRV